MNRKFDEFTGMMFFFKFLVCLKIKVFHAALFKALQDFRFAKNVGKYIL